MSTSYLDGTITTESYEYELPERSGTIAVKTNIPFFRDLNGEYEASGTTSVTGSGEVADIFYLDTSNISLSVSSTCTVTFPSGNWFGWYCSSALDNSSYYGRHLHQATQGTSFTTMSTWRGGEPPGYLFEYPDFPKGEVVYG